MYQSQQKLLNVLTQNGILPAEKANQADAEAQAANILPENILLEKKIITDEQLLEAKSKLFRLPVADIEGKEYSKKVLSVIPKEVSENYQIIALDLKGNNLDVGIVNPQNFKAFEVVDFLAQKKELKVTYHLISQNDFKNVSRQYQVLGDEVKEVLLDMSDGDREIEKQLLDSNEMEKVIKSAPVSKIVLVIIRHAIDGRASDIHVEPSVKDTKIRYRIDGILKTSLVLPKYIHSAIVSRIKVLANLKLDEARKPQDGRIRLTVDNREVDLRVSTLPVLEGEKVVLRILDTTATAPDLVQLGFSEHHISLMEKAIQQPYGLVLLTGPTGSGKTTTLYALLTMMNKDDRNVITLEDPIEYYLDGLNQSQVQPEIGYTFASGLRAILRQDPNIVMVGEIRDNETTELVVHASLTGHMILSTLHTNDSIGAIPRLIDLGAESFLLSSVINIIIAQRLARKICTECKKETEIPAPVLKRIQKQISEIPAKYLVGVSAVNPVFYKGEGCSHCGGTGYQGRTAVAEIIDITADMRDIINRGGAVAEIKTALKKQDFITLVQDALIKALQGKTTLDEVMRVSKM